MGNVIHIGVFFDGTQNHIDLDKATKDGSQTNVAKLFELYYDDSTHKRIYERGVGTQEVSGSDIEAIEDKIKVKSDFYDAWDSATGWGDEGVKERVEEAITKITGIFSSFHQSSGVTHSLTQTEKQL